MTDLPYEPIEFVQIMNQGFLIVTYLYTSAPLHGLGEVRSLSSDLLVALHCGLALRRQRNIADLAWHSISLSEWREGINIRGASDFAKKLFGFGEGVSAIEIWEDTKRKDYWFDVLKPLTYWQSSVECVQLDTVNWQAKPNCVRVTIAGLGETDIFPKKEEQGEGWGFWTLGTSAKTANIPSELLRGELLLAQLVAQQGRGKLTVEATEKRLSMHLTIPRADTTPSPGEEGLMFPTAVAIRMVNRIARMVIKSVLQIGDQLSSTLAKAIDCYEMPPGAEGDREGMVDWLQSAHQKLCSHLQSVAAYWEEVQQHNATDTG